MKFSTLFLLSTVLLLSTVSADWRKSNSAVEKIQKLRKPLGFEEQDYTPQQMKASVAKKWGAIRYAYEPPKLTLVIQGTIVCNGTGAPFLAPYVHFEGSPETVTGGAFTDVDGKFVIHSEASIDKKLVLVVKHKCPVEGLKLPTECPIPYFLTTHKFDEYAGFVSINWNLNTMKDSTSPECFY